MVRSTLIFVTVLALASVVVSSLSLDDYKSEKTHKHLIRRTLQKLDGKLRNDKHKNLTIADLEEGILDDVNESFGDELTIQNLSDKTNTTYVVYELESDEIVHYLRVVNKNNEINAVVFPTLYSTEYPGFTLFGVRVLPNTNATFSVSIAYHS